jgi:hypothetical protein
MIALQQADVISTGTGDGWPTRLCDVFVSMDRLPDTACAGDSLAADEWTANVHLSIRAVDPQSAHNFPAKPFSDAKPPTVP